MEKIEDILNSTTSNEVSRWTVNTTKSNLIGYERNEKLSQEIANWEIHKNFAEKYGLMFHYPEDYISIYIIISLLKNFRILCHPDEQQTNSSIDNLRLEYDNVRWLYTEEIHYDKEDKYNIYSKEFYSTAYYDFTDRRGLLKILWDLTFKKNPKSRIYELSNSYQIHQTVICGGNGDVHKCPNYYGIRTDEQKKSIIKILSSQENPPYYKY